MDHSGGDVGGTQPSPQRGDSEAKVSARSFCITPEGQSPYGSAAFRRRVYVASLLKRSTKSALFEDPDLSEHGRDRRVVRHHDQGDVLVVA